MGFTMDEVSESEIFFSRRTDKTQVGSAFTTLEGKVLRIATRAFDSAGFEFAKVGDELLIRRTPTGRFEIKVTFVEADRSFQSVVIQRFTGKGSPKEGFWLSPHEVTLLLNHLTNLKRIHFPDAGSLNVPDADLNDLLLTPQQAKRLVGANQELLAALAKTEITSEDIVALGYRKEQLAVFERLLEDPDYFETVLQDHPKGPEDVWQAFFEKNPWIFGYGLSLINFGPLDNRKLEQVVRGFSVLGSGKRVDGLLKSHALLSTTAFVEIKRHTTDLLTTNAYRPGIWQPSKELSGAVSQVQGTVSAAMEHWRAKEDIVDANGNPTGETLFTTEPRSFVVCGRLAEFQTERGVNEKKFRSFELYRRNLMRPEIVTFDELYQRARLIVAAEHTVPDKAPEEPCDDDDLPF